LARAASERGRPTIAESARQLLSFIERGRRAAWIGLALLSVTVTVLEVAAALLIFLITRLVADPRASLDLPIVGDVRAHLPGLDDRQIVVLAMATIAGFFLIRAIIVLVQSYVRARVAERTGVRLATRLFRGYLQMPYALHLQRNSSELIRNVTDAVNDVVDYTLTPAVRLASELLVMIGLGIALVLAAPLAAGLAFALFVPLMVVLFGLIQPRISALGNASHRLARSVLEALHQSLYGFRDITLLGREPFFHERYRATREQIARTRYLRQFLGEVPRIALETGLILFVALFLGIAVANGESPQESLAVLGMFAYAALRILPSLNHAVLLINDLRFGAAAAAAVYRDLTTLEDASTVPSGMDDRHVAPLPLRDAIRLERVSYTYPGTDREALVTVDLEIRQGEMIGLVGPTGGGKSTLVDVILGLLPPTEGRVLVDGMDIGGNVAGWHRNLGVVPQTVYLLDDTLRRNVALGLDDEEIAEERVKEAVRLAQLDEFVAELPEGLDSLVGERGARISGGQRQRVAIARALYRRPVVLVFDEGTSALDTLTEAEVLRALTSLRRERTMILVAHRLTTVRGCDRILLVDGGRILDEGSFDQLVQRNPTFRSMATPSTRAEHPTGITGG
jgi:ABC-type multidrug transport system fused ATPase/permease subunit